MVRQEGGFERRGAAAWERENWSLAGQLVSVVTGAAPALLRSPRRERAPIALSRQITLYLLHVEEGMTLSAAAAALGRERTTAGHACRLVEDRRDEPAFDRRVEGIALALKRARLAARAMETRR